jgi:hypothetical protein
MALDLLAIAVCGLVLGGWAVPLGFILNVPPVLTYLAASLGGIVGCWALVFFANKVTAWWSVRRSNTSARHDRRERATGRARALVDRWGVKGVGLIGPIFPGVTVSVLAGIAVGLDRRQLARWMTLGVALMYGLYVIGVAVLIELW